MCSKITSVGSIYFPVDLICVTSLDMKASVSELTVPSGVTAALFTAGVLDGYIVSAVLDIELLDELILERALSIDENCL